MGGKAGKSRYRHVFFQVFIFKPLSASLYPPAPTAFQEGIASKTKATPSPGPTVLFFIGCLIDTFFPRIADAAMAVFHYHRINVVIPKPQGCCGMPSASAGDGDTMKQLIRHHLAIFSRHDFDVVVTACATCTHVIKNIWPQMTKNESEDIYSRAMDIAAKTQDISQFIESHTRTKGAPGNHDRDIRTVTYHDPCHLKKVSGFTPNRGL